MQRNREKRPETETETERRVERQICEDLNEVSQDQREEKRNYDVYRLLLFFFLSLSIAGVKSKKNSKTYMDGVHEGKERERERDGERGRQFCCERGRERRHERGRHFCCVLPNGQVFQRTPMAFPKATA
jgi:hypothetical protein